MNTAGLFGSLFPLASRVPRQPTKGRYHAASREAVSRMKDRAERKRERRKLRNIDLAHRGGFGPEGVGWRS